MSDTGEKNDKRLRNEDSIPTKDISDSTVGRSGQESVPTASFEDSAAKSSGQVEPGCQVDHFKLLSKLGEGGFAEVYLAEQLKPVKRQVALKVIKPGMDSAQVIARFEAERQALALLDHPNIAQVYDAGTTASGRPYFVMEHVKGVSLTEHCDREKLSIEERLSLFGQVCDAIQHAHQKGIIHRDIKPSNILVSFEDQRALPKVIDFGIAKAIKQPLTERTLFTVQGQLIGTPMYMSPEQADMTAQDIDTRSDIYSLGVVLYELLTGTLPFNQDSLERAGYAEILRIIREEDPSRPSTRLSSLGEEATKVAESRRTEVAKLAKRLHRELEWIPLKAMRKERAHRYRSASELADDIQNYLNGAPLIAGPESAVYRVRKFVRRNRVSVTASVAVAAAIVVGFVGITAMYFQAEKERNRADEEAESHRRALYLNRIALANAKWHDADISDVYRLLALCPEDLRGWEWYHLLHISDQSLVTLSGHTHRINSVGFSPDGKHIVSGSVDNTIKIWDAEMGSEVMTLRGHQAQITSVAFSPDGKRIVSGSYDNTVKFWDPETGAELMNLKSPASSVAFSSDGRRIVSGGGKINVWDAETGTVIMTLQGHLINGNRYYKVTSVTFSPDGRRIVSGSMDNTIKIWDVETGSEVMILHGHQSVGTSVAFSPDGRRIVTGSYDRTIKVWDANTGLELMTLRGHQGSVTSVAFSPDGRRIVSGSGDRTIKVWDVETEVELMTIRGHIKSVYSVAFSPDGSRVVSGSEDNTIKVWNTEMVSEVVTLSGHQRGVQSVAFSPDDRRIVSGSYDKTVRVWDAETGYEVMTLYGHEGPVSSVAFSPDGRRIVSGSSTIKIWDAKTGAAVMILHGHQGTVTSVAFSPDARRIVSTSYDKTVRIWDAETGTEVMILHGHEGPVNSVAFSPDGRRIVSGSYNTITVWDANKGMELMTLHGQRSYVMSVAFSPDGRCIVSGSDDKTIKVWDAETGAEIMALPGHEKNVKSVAFSPDGRRIVSGSWDNTVKVWDATNGTELMTLRQHKLEVLSVAFSPDGRRIVSGSFDSTIKVWGSASPEEWEVTLLFVREYIRSGQLKEAEKLVEELRVLAGRRDTKIASRAESVITLLGDAYHRRANTKVNDGKFGEAIGDYEKAVRVNPGNAQAFNELAWLQATCPDAEFRNGAKATENATKACQLLDWKNAVYIDTLAAAYSEAGDFTNAVKWQKQAMYLLSEWGKVHGNYEARLKLYQSNQPYHKGHLWSFSAGKLIGWWKFDETEGRRAVDSSGNGNNGILIGGPTWQPSSGRIGGALLFDGDRDDVVQVINESNFDISGSITVAAWIKVNRFDKGWPTIVAKGDTDWMLARDRLNMGIEFSCNGVRVRGNPASGNIVGRRNVNDGRWHHVCGTYDGANIRLYVDGVENSTSPMAYRGNINTNNTRVTIGHNYSQRSGRGFYGLIDDVRIYSYALNQDEIKELCDVHTLPKVAAIYGGEERHQATGPQPAGGAIVKAPTTGLRWIPGIDAIKHKVYFGTKSEELALLAEVSGANYSALPSLKQGTVYYWRVDEVQADGSVVAGNVWNFIMELVGWWKLDETKDNGVADSSGNGNDGTLKGNPTWQPSGGRIGGSLLFDGDGDYVEIENESNFDITDEITVAAWIKVNKFDKAWQTIIAKGDNAWRLARDMRNNGIEFACTLGNHANLIGQRNVNDGKWHHVCGTYKRGNIRLYVDGMEDSASPRTYRGKIGTNDYNVWIGNNSQAPIREWNGLIDDVRIYIYALSKEQIKALYEGKEPPREKEPG